MTGKARLFWSMVLMLAAIGIGGGTATAASLSFEPGGAVRLTSLGKLTFEAGVSFSCNFTFNGEIETTNVTKTVGMVLGEVNEVRWRECTGSEIENVLGLPWAITYQSILGTLPEAVTGIGLAIERWDWRLSTFGGFVRCRYRGDALFLMGVTGSNPYTSGLLRSLENTISLVEGGGCPANGSYRGSLRLEAAQRITRDARGGGGGITASPTEMNFGRINAGEVARRTLTLEFESAARVREARVRTGQAFAVTDPGRCVGSEVAARGRCTFTVLFVPPSERRATEYSDELTIETSIGSVRVPLRGGTN